MDDLLFLRPYLLLLFSLIFRFSFTPSAPKFSFVHFALDMQVMGACCADERLNPLLKLNASNGVAEDRLLAHLTQHFEPSEVAMLARCLCIPLVSICVGKINKQGTLLSPTSTSMKKYRRLVKEHMEWFTGLVTVSQMKLLL